MPDIVICEPLRTPVGRFTGALRDVPPETLAATVIRALVDRTGIDPAAIDDVVLGQAGPNGEAPALGRIAALDAGLGIAVPGYQVDRRCGSGLQAVLAAAGQIASGGADIVVAGGAESMSRTEFYDRRLRWEEDSPADPVDRLARARVTAGGRLHPVPGGMVETAENLRAEYAIPRAAQDDLAFASHGKAVAAQRAGRFADEIVPVPTDSGTVDTDEHPRPNVDRAKLATLTALRSAVDPDATVTAGNASGQNDGAAAAIVASAEAARAHGLTPMARLVSWSITGVAPERMGIGPVPATAAALSRAGIGLADLDVIELNEAFAAQVLAVLAEWGLSPEDPRLNPNGSGISLGHPVGATGARILATGLHELRRREGRYLLETMCIGGGQGIAAVFERVS
ncbi:Beta-ketothiolase BktB (plasmid) [Tsukamurella tyrosinosolvens]|uniref:Probable acetyl-CoA acetyltransferase n=1 Tax=Tsukamurella tyrosinosolvens TaxID=57704 RepID=A0A1H4PSI2_TSUTY|nr:acetyl-CoA C-acetyltransferase [Tsukamurella tyrosinosolvens]KXO97435.1 acetyl-CoA acetyltransferase [Tsukamurella tyrosinosolvens]SEC10162.1 acetyl-CoA C-acetyltransferase [Tsukamurella tyrosinosolvens]VEH96942.1 Beta-ketothiolase BktB [Tsukamurella tyrosinosolvens]